MSAHAQILADFRSQVTRLLQEREHQWDASRRLVGAGQLPGTLRRLREEASKVNLPAEVRETITSALQEGHVERIQDLPGPRLKELTGLPPTKAVRALCVWFDLLDVSDTDRVEHPVSDAVLSHLDQPGFSPFDILLAVDSPSLLDLGAGDLSFATELAERYASVVRRQGRTLTLHCVDRLHPQSRLGGPLHPTPARLELLRNKGDLSFQFYGDQDMFGLDRLDRSGKLLPRYAIVTCWAPATPTFAYEPTRLRQDIILQDLKQTKGSFHQTDYAGEPALEVRQGGRALLFPPWKFDIRGPLALLDLLARRGQACVLGATDSQVFWETLAQLLDDDAYRPIDRLFAPETLPEVFGELFDRLSSLGSGDLLSLGNCVRLRERIPRVLPTHGRYASHFRFRSAYIRRGAEFPGMPASSTARRFREMVEEPPPWMVVLVPDISSRL